MLFMKNLIETGSVRVGWHGHGSNQLQALAADTQLVGSTASRDQRGPREALETYRSYRSKLWLLTKKRVQLCVLRERRAALQVAVEPSLQAQGCPDRGHILHFFFLITAGRNHLE